MRIGKYQILILFVMCQTTCTAQSNDGRQTRTRSYTDSLNASLSKNNSTSIIGNADSLIIDFYRNICKDLRFRMYRVSSQNAELKKKDVRIDTLQKPKFLTIHGNISYDFFYRSKIDTPLNINDFQQHTERVYLNILVKEKYPLKVSFAARQSNSPFFRNFLDMNLQFDPNTFRRNLKEDLIKKLTLKLLHSGKLDSLENELAQNIKKYSSLKAGLESSSTLQKIIEERERKYHEKNRQKRDTMSANFSFDEFNLNRLEYKFGKLDFSKANTANRIDTGTTIFTNQYNKRKNEADSLAGIIRFLQIEKDSVTNVIRSKTLETKQEIYHENSEKELSKIAIKEGIRPDSISRFEKNLLAIKDLNIGRCMLNYTELTARNISITGVNVAYNPSYYIAFAAGKTDYRFHDFLNRKANLGNQYLVLGRFGIGDIEKNALILTAFKGRKDQSSYALPDSITGNINILGYSVEGIFKKNKYTSLSVEFAKSTKPLTGNLSANKEVNSLWQYTDKTNMGINMKAETALPQTDTKISGFFRKTGENFQSFSLFSYNTDQTAWQARVDQSFLKRKVSLTGMLRRNDFTNPFTEKTYKTSTTFETFILNVHYPKYPSLSLGYYPGTQLYVIDKDRISENAYYILNGSLLYYYNLKGIGMNTSLVFNRYFNKATDSGFVLNKGINYYGSQTIFLKKLQLQASYSFTRQTELEYYTAESAMDYPLAGFLKIGAGIKYNKIHEGEDYYGKRLQFTFDFKRLGGLQFQYEKSYLPTLNQTLYPIETGRISWYKYF